MRKLLRRIYVVSEKEIDGEAEPILDSMICKDTDVK